MSKSLMQLCKEVELEKNSRLEWDMIPNLVRLCCTLLYVLSELSTAESWANENSVLYPILSEWGQNTYWYIVLKVISSINWEFVIEMISLTPLDWYTRYVTFYKMYLSARKFSLGKKTFCFTKTQKIFGLWSLIQFRGHWLFIKRFKFSVTHKHCL